jgi:hypothetical protein
VQFNRNLCKSYREVAQFITDHTAPQPSRLLSSLRTYFGNTCRPTVHRPRDDAFWIGGGGGSAGVLGLLAVRETTERLLVGTTDGSTAIRRTKNVKHFA